MEYLIEFSLFVGKILIIVIGIIAVLVTVASIALKNKQVPPGIEVTSLNMQYQEHKEKLNSHILSKKKNKTESKKRKKKSQKEEPLKNTVYVLNFHGDMKASEVKQLREEISAILQVAKKDEEVVVNIESPGGAVHGYGLAAAQLLRIKNHGCKLTVCVDKVAASGGYMMACTADKILSAPFAILGSIGVIAQIPNLHKLLKKNDVDYEEITSGEYKRTVSLLGEITEKGKAKFTEQITDIHQLFKEFVNIHRPQLNIDDVSTGEYWFGQRAISKKLADEIMTSDEYLMKKTENSNVYSVTLKAKKKLGERFAEAISLGVQKSFEAALNKWNFIN